MTIEELIKQITNRFLGWKLPDDFSPDAGISFKRDFNEGTKYPMKHEPIGTNLFTAVQTEEMIRYILGDTLDSCTCSGLSCDCPIHSKDRIIR